MSIDCQAVNPANRSQARVFYEILTAEYYGEKGHPTAVMARIAGAHDFRVMASRPQPMADGWEFWIEFGFVPSLPDYVRAVLWRAAPAQ